METLFTGGRIVDLIFVLVAFEAFAVVLWRFLKGGGPALSPFIINLLAGVFLMAALRNALAGSSWTWIAVCLLGAFAAHLADLVWRWESVDAHGSVRLRQTRASLGQR